MRTWLIWIASFFVLILLGVVHPHGAEQDAFGLVIGFGFFVWVVAGLLLTARATMRFLRR